MLDFVNDERPTAVATTAERVHRRGQFFQVRDRTRPAVDSLDSKVRASERLGGHVCCDGLATACDNVGLE